MSLLGYGADATDMGFVTLFSSLALSGLVVAVTLATL